MQPQPLSQQEEQSLERTIGHIIQMPNHSREDLIKAILLATCNAHGRPSVQYDLCTYDAAPEIELFDELYFNIILRKTMNAPPSCAVTVSPLFNLEEKIDIKSVHYAAKAVIDIPSDRRFTAQRNLLLENMIMSRYQARGYKIDMSPDGFGALKQAIMRHYQRNRVPLESDLWQKAPSIGMYIYVNELTSRDHQHINDAIDACYTKKPKHDALFEEVPQIHLGI